MGEKACAWQEHTCVKEIVDQIDIVSYREQPADRIDSLAKGRIDIYHCTNIMAHVPLQPVSCSYM